MVGRSSTPYFHRSLELQGLFWGLESSNMIKKRKLVVQEASNLQWRDVGFARNRSPFLGHLMTGRILREPVKRNPAMAAEVGTGNDEARFFEGWPSGIPLGNAKLADAVSFTRALGERFSRFVACYLVKPKEGIRPGIDAPAHQGPRISAVLVTVFPLAYFVLMMFIAPDLFRPFDTARKDGVAGRISPVFCGNRVGSTIIQSVDAD